MMESEIQEPRLYHVEIAEIAIAAILCTAFHALLRRPMYPLLLAYYDDGETLHLVLSLLEGKVPYTEFVTHHFIGYALPALLWAKLMGFSPELLFPVRCLTIGMTGAGIYAAIRTCAPARGAALLGALAYCAAREPEVLGFFPQYTINLLLAWAIYFSFREIGGGRAGSSAFLAGAALVTDQRALFLALLPLMTLPYRPDKLRALTVTFGAYVVVPIIGLVYLGLHGALGEMYEQCFEFPLHLRNASSDAVSRVSLALAAQSYVVTTTPLLFVGALVAIASLARAGWGWWKPLLVAGLPGALMPILGGRDLDYYSLTWNPWLALTTGLGLALVHRALLRNVLLLAAAGTALIAVLGSLAIAFDPKVRGYDGDGAEEVADYLLANMTASDRIYVWGYRQDIYARIGRPSALRFGSAIVVHPDQAITDTSARALHVHKGYEEEFVRTLSEHPPEYLVIFERKDSLAFSSRAQNALFELVRDRGTLVFEVQKSDFLDAPCSFKVFRLTTNDSIADS